MSEPEPIDLSQLQNINLRPDWVEDLQKRDPAAGEVVWGRAPDSGRDGGGGRGRDFGGGGQGNRGPRPGGNFGGGQGGGGGGRPFDRDNRGGPPRGPRQDDRRGPAGPGQGAGGGGGQGNRGPRPGGNFGGGGGGGGGGGQGGPGQGQGQFQGQNRGPRPGGPGGGDRPQFQNRGGQGGGGGNRDDRRGGPGQGGGGGGGRFERGGRPPFGQDRPMPAPLPGWAVKLYAEPRALDAITRQIKASGRAYPVFELGRLFLASRDRYVAHFFRKAPPQPQQQQQRGPKGGPEEPAPVPQQQQPPQQEGPEELFQCTADESLWTSREEAVRHAMHGGVLEKYYRTETVTVDPPKGIFTAIAVCGFSGAPLGPPNHHAFQTNVAHMHRERFANLPIDRYKSRIQVVKDEAAVAKWLESQTSITQYVPLQVAEGTEPVPFKSTAEMEAHFLKNHAGDAVRAVKQAKVTGNIPGKLLARGLLDLLRLEVEAQQRFPMQLVQDLCRDLEKQHLKFFKRDRKATFVSRSRPHYLENEDHLSSRIRSIIGIVRANPGITYGTLVSTLAPHVEPAVTGDAGTPSAPAPVETETEATAAVAAPVEDSAVTEAPVAETPAAEEAIAAVPTEEAVAEVAPAPAAEEPAPTEAAVEEAAPAEEITPETEPEAASIPEGEATTASEEVVAAEEPAPATVSEEAPAATEASASAEPVAEPLPAPVIHLSPEEIAILQDLRWLVQEGYVTEFNTGELQVLGRPHVPPTPKQEKAPKPPREDRRKPRPDAPAGAEAEAATAPAETSESPAPSEGESDATASPEASAAESSAAAEAATEAKSESPDVSEVPAGETVAPDSDTPPGESESKPQE